MAKTTKTQPAKKKAETFLLVFVLDRTGSMSSCLQSTVSGFNEFLHQQQKEKAGEAAMTLVKFDANPPDPVCQLAYTTVKLSDVADLGTKANPYEPRGNTPLFDAVGQTIVNTDAVADKYDHILFIVQTDGQENASHEYDQGRVFDMVGERRKAGWDFRFMGANIDAYAISKTMNVAVTDSLSYDSAHQSPAAFASLSASTSRYRQSGGDESYIDALAGAPVARPSSPQAPTRKPGKVSKPSRSAPKWLR